MIYEAENSFSGEQIISPKRFFFHISVLAVLSIYIPVESGEKIGLGVTLLLAQVVNLLILSSLLPASSQFFPQLG